MKHGSLIPSGTHFSFERQGLDDPPRLQATSGRNVLVYDLSRGQTRWRRMRIRRQDQRSWQYHQGENPKNFSHRTLSPVPETCTTHRI
jgi:hypothetical protein